ncbi:MULTISPECIES: sensor histidine kinase [Halanaerobium]|uniref:histidine kinase n=1 Tax=Halanaerobium kushneri TaxID=56779 RepID=A0A1N6XBX4_9FIRM|nr:MULTISPECIES: HAMP domain-containing sensor histidine kinase [Halanaerobium]RCW62051.1 heavy metal sensor kinase [Halanaerobium sp. ST460_2HS_T2]SIQ99759.1 heavy metal sensor kinase [Halanaerobium kushneri]
MNKTFTYKNYSLKFNLTVWYMIILFLVLIIFSSILYFYLEDQLKEEVYNLLEIEITKIKADFINDDKILNNTGDQNIKAFFYNNQGELLNDNSKEGLINNIISADYNEKFTIKEYKDQKWALLTEAYNLDNSKSSASNGYITLLYSFNKEDKMLDKLIIILIFMIPLTLLFASGGGYFLARQALKAIDIISSTAEKISQNNLSQRIDIPESREDEIGRLGKTLNNLLDRLETSFFRQKQFNADVSHELKTPISVIRAQVEEALDSDQKLTSEQKDILTTIKKQIDQLNNLISQMLILAKADEKNFTLEKEKFDLEIVIDTVIEEMNNLAAEKNILITKKIIGENNFRIKADLSLITQLLLNLVDNAIKYTPNEGKIKITLKNLDNYYEINILDNGIGIPKKDLNNIFKRFYRVDKSRSRDYGGTGLGLSICSWIVKVHGGEINVESSLRNGTKFRVMLPKK